MIPAVEYTRRVKVGAVYTNGWTAAVVTKVAPLGYVQMRDIATDDQLGFGILAFRREWWMVRAAPDG